MGVSALNRYYRKEIRKGNFPLCYLCGQPIKKQNEVSQDHLIPKCISHDNRRINLVVSHKACNNARGCMSVQEWFDRQRS